MKVISLVSITNIYSWKYGLDLQAGGNMETKQQSGGGKIKKGVKL